MHTLEQLNNGELLGVTRLQVRDNLTDFPSAIYDLADTLEVLDLSDNQLRDLPDDLHRLSHLRILFCSNNRFTHLPESIGQCDRLEMIGFKHNQIRHVSAASLPLLTRWLILTDNEITELPERIGTLCRLQKLALAGNRLTSLPATLSHCRNLELIRLSANQLSEFPDVLLELPRLAWLAFSGNPFCCDREPHDEFQTVPYEHVILHDVLGQGASGVISKASWAVNTLGVDEVVAVKVFKGEVTSDGFPEDELDACLSVGDHGNLVKPLAKINEPACSALIMGLIPEDYVNLGQPPSLETCTRDTFTQGQAFSVNQVAHIIEQMTALVEHFRAKKVSHGDLYAHNVLINPQGHILFGDFGAASKYANLPEYQQVGIETIEQRALDFFIEDMQSLLEDSLL